MPYCMHKNQDYSYLVPGTRYQVQVPGIYFNSYYSCSKRDILVMPKYKVTLRDVPGEMAQELVSDLRRKYHTTAVV